MMAGGYDMNVLTRQCLRCVAGNTRVHALFGCHACCGGGGSHDVNS